jgi:hypothetical protein
MSHYVGFEAFTNEIVTSSIFWDVTPYNPLIWTTWRCVPKIELLIVQLVSKGRREI